MPRFSQLFSSYIRTLCLLLQGLGILFSLTCGHSAFADSRPRDTAADSTLAVNTIVPTTRALDLAATLGASELAARLQSCADGPFEPSTFSIAHRGAPLGYPEHSREGYIAAAKMGAGIIECDVTFTADKQLVCRHSQCDLATTTNILQTPLHATCRTPFTPAERGRKATAQCCTSDITLAEFKSLCARPDRSNPNAQSVAAFLAPLESPTVAEPLACGTLVTHQESIALIGELGAAFIPELKAPMVAMPFAPGFDQRAYAGQLVAEYTAAEVQPERVYLQSFDLADVLYWIDTYPEYAAQAVYLDSRSVRPGYTPSLADMQSLYEQGLRIIAPPIPALVALNEAGQPVATDYARFAKAAGLDIMTWTFESGAVMGKQSRAYGHMADYMDAPGRMLDILHVLADSVGVRGIFSDWPGTVTYYANCMNR